MKISRKLLSIVLVVFALIGLISCTTKEEEGSKKESEKINLNIKNADIIASFTDNEKYEFNFKKSKSNIQAGKTLIFY